MVSITRFGAFVEVLPGIEGLIHNTELSWTDRSLSAKKAFEVGQEVTSRVLEVDLDQHEKARLEGILKTLQAQGAEKLAGEVQGYLAEHFGGAD